MRRLLVSTLVVLGATTAAAYADGPGGAGIGTSLVVSGGRISYTAAISRDSTRTRVAMWGRRTLVHERRLLACSEHQAAEQAGHNVVPVWRVGSHPLTLEREWQQFRHGIGLTQKSVGSGRSGDCGSS